MKIMTKKQIMFQIDFSDLGHKEYLKGFIEKLKEYPVVNIYRVFHLCEYCDKQMEGDKTVCAMGNGEIRVIGKDGQVYSAPKLIIHYIEAHGYKVPDEFIEAVMRPILSVII